MAIQQIGSLIGALGSAFGSGPTGAERRYQEFLESGGGARRAASDAARQARAQGSAVAARGTGNAALAARMGNQAAESALERTAEQRQQNFLNAKAQAAQMERQWRAESNMRKMGAVGAALNAAGTVGGMLVPGLGATSNAVSGIGQQVGAAAAGRPQAPQAAGGGDPLGAGQPFGGVLGAIDQMFPSGFMTEEELRRRGLR